MMKISTRKEMSGYIFLSPWLIGSVFLLFVPMIYSLWLSFARIDDITNLKTAFVGLDNYKRAFLTDVDFLYSLKKIISHEVIIMPLILIFSLIIAIMISRNIKMRGMFRVIFFLPVVLGTGNVMQQLLNQGVDSLSIQDVTRTLLSPQIQEYIGAGATKVVSVFLGTITTVLWRSGVQIIIFLAGIQKIPNSLYESARVDSATEWEMFWKITLPMLAPILLLNIVYTIIASFAERSPMVEYLLYIGFNKGEFEYSAAMGWSYFVFILAIIGIAFLIMKPFVKNVTDN